MRKKFAGLSPVYVLIVLVLLMVGCGGGGSLPDDNDNQQPNPSAAVAQFSFPDSQGRMIDTESNYEDGAKTTISLDQQVNITAQLFGRDIKHGDQRGRLEITAESVDEAGSPMINGLQGKFIATMGGKNIAPAGNGRFVVSLSGRDIAELAPNGEWVDVTIGFDVTDEWFGRMLLNLNDYRVPPEAEPERDSNGDGHSEWRAFGVLTGIAILAAIFPCPTDYETYKFRVEPGEVVPPPPPPVHTLDLNGPGTAVFGSVVTITTVSDCPQGWEAEWTEGSTAGVGNSQFSITMPMHDLVVTAHDGCGNVSSHTVRLVIVPPPVNEPPVAKLTATPSSGTAPLAVRLDGTSSYDPDGTIVKYEFDVDGNGTWDVSNGNGIADWTYQEGSWTPMLRVTDNSGAMATTSTIVTLAAPPPVDIYAGAQALLTPQDPFLDPYVGDEQQFVVRIYASDGLAELPLPAGATKTWASSPDGFVDSSGVFFSALALDGSVLLYEAVTVTCTISWPGHELTDQTVVHLVPQG